jgi:hypothetical protein
MFVLLRHQSNRSKQSLDPCIVLYCRECSIKSRDSVVEWDTTIALNLGSGNNYIYGNWYYQHDKTEGLKSLTTRDVK